ncbi:MAG: FMN-binding negative transcriptional regulator [Pseudomonadota bacterium]
MYEIEHFNEDRLAVQQALVEKHPLGLLICNDDNGRSVANPVPFTLDRNSGERGTLKAHLARPNSQWRLLQAAADCLVVFQGAEAYISPNWYPTKKVHGKVVPTWDYMIVQIRGKPVVHQDPDWLRAQIEHLTARHEASQPKPWKVDDAPPRFTKAMLNGIVGIEIPITEIHGKWKLSQNRSVQDVAGVRDGLTEVGELGLAAEVASRIRED